MILQFIKIGFLTITIWDIVDILIVGYLIYLIYNLVKGSIAFNIFLGLIFIYIAYWLVRALNMVSLSLILNQFISVGVIALLIVFQPEVRRFLLLLGKGTLSKQSGVLTRIFKPETIKDQVKISASAESIVNSFLKLSASKTGALILFTPNPEFYDESGVPIEAKISEPLLLSIFHKESPIHDGAVIIGKDKIHLASCVLPLTDAKLPQGTGLRHRAAVGATENSDAITIIVSEETGQISYAREGKLTKGISEQQLRTLLKTFYKGTVV